MAKISVVVPAYNVEEYIAPCLDSIFSQTEKDLEVIVVDDKSCDNTLEVVGTYEKKYPNRMRVVSQSENKGVSAARNKGLSLATGDYVGFVDGDDIVTPTMYEELSFGLSYKEDIDIASTNIAFLSLQDHSQTSLKKAKVISPTNSPRILFWQSPSCCNHLYKRELLGENPFEEGIIFEDFAFTYPIFMKARKVMQFDGSYYLYRNNLEGITASTYKVNPKVLSAFRVAEILEEAKNTVSNGEKFEEEIRALEQTILLQRAPEIAKWDIEQEERQAILYLLDDAIRVQYGDWEEMPYSLYQTRIDDSLLKEVGLYERRGNTSCTYEETKETLTQKVYKHVRKR